MKTYNYNWENLHVEAHFSVFEQTAGHEIHAFFKFNNTTADTVTQFQSILKCVDIAQKELIIIQNSKAVFKRYFVSDAINQYSLIPIEKQTAVSVVQQPPLDGSKLAVWIYWVENAEIKSGPANTVNLKRSAYKHIYSTQMNSCEGDEADQTDAIFGDYSTMLRQRQLTLKNHCIRTWLYVQGVDVHYAGLVIARKKHFEFEGLGPDTHYIASTGIEGKFIHPENLILMDAYAIEGIRPEQITFLRGLTHLNPTIEYGVTFERATAVDYGDRRHIYVSGTASIDNKGEIVHKLNIDKQIYRTLENIEVLLAEGNALTSDIAQMIVYLRDSADYETVKNRLQKRLPEIPKVIVWAPVCRPGWLIEIECIAIVKQDNNHFPCF